MDVLKQIFSSIFLLLWFVACASTMRCSNVNSSNCANKPGCDTFIECPKPDHNKRPHCYVLWENNSMGFKVHARGCWLDDKSCYGREKCVENKVDGRKNMFFCCCDGDMCNTEMYYQPIPITSSPYPKDLAEEPIEMKKFEDIIFKALFYPLFPLFGLVVILVIFFWVYRKRKMSEFNEVPTVDPMPLPPPSPLLGLRPIQLIEIKARGRFGAVWKAQIMSEYVAVKIFPLQDETSWLVEQEMYRLPQMKHENILAFIGTEKRGDNLQAEYWLISSFHEKGSLCDYLKANLISWAELCKIAESMTRGLTHLHEELPATKAESYKPSIAHRDFKSKNVLLKEDNTACIADLGLAVVFHPGGVLSDAHGQVGTRRYMAPEVLEGAINFQRDSFLRIDMYACGLVLWELLSRCSLQDGPVDEYRLPFEEEVGQHPTLEDMQDAVVHNKKRPEIRDSWRKSEVLSVVCDTIQECWDHDAEARLSASCIQERISTLCKSLPAVKTIPPQSNQGCRNSALTVSNHGVNSMIINAHPNYKPLVAAKESSI